MMARLRQVVETPTEKLVVPPELLDHASTVWRNRRLFGAWMAENTTSSQRSVDSADPCQWFNAALDAWVETNRLHDPIYHDTHDHVNLRRLGVHPCRRLREVIQ